LNDSTGAFDGVVIVAIGADYFVSGYEATKLGEHGVLGFLGADGVFRVRRTGDSLFSGAFPTAAKSGRGRFVDQSVDRKTCQLTGAPRGFSLFVIEVRRHSDNCRINGFFEVVLGIRLDACEYERREFLG
jgi:hypothetical protein